MKKKRQSGFPYDPTPMNHCFSGEPEDCFDMVNRYGTYEIQRTADTENEFPAIAQGMPKAIKETFDKRKKEES